MQLVINRRQADVKGMLGGHKGVNFTLSYRLVLTQEEAELVERYRLVTYPVTRSNRPGGERIPDDTIGNMIAGRSMTLGDVTTLVRNEDIVKTACDSLPVLFDVVRSLGGDEVIDYPRK
jgi:hypothetical protein